MPVPLARAPVTALRCRSCERHLVEEYPTDRSRMEVHMIKETEPGAGRAAQGDRPGPEGAAAAKDPGRPVTDQGRLVYKEKKRLGFLGLPFTFTTYLLYENDIQIRRGLFSVVEDDCYMYRVIDVQLRVSFLQRLFGLGTVICVTSDATNKTITLKNIRRSKEIKNFIYRASEEAKMRRRTVNMQNIGAFEDLDGDGMPD